MTNRRSTRYHIEITREDGSKEVIEALSVRKSANKRAAFVAQDFRGWPSVVSVEVIDTMPALNECKAIYARTLETYEAADLQAMHRLDWFKALGASHAALAIDQIDAYEDSRLSHDENLADTLRENHPEATDAQVNVAFDAYNDAWEAHLYPKRYATTEEAQQMELGVTGDVTLIDNQGFERLVDRDNKNLSCWISYIYDDNGEVCDWDRVPEDEAIILGLVR